MFFVRFDMRSPAGTTPERYAAAIDMAAWAEANGAFFVTLSEHHGSDDGYLPSPLVLASAMAARTSTVPIVVAAVILPLHDPVRLAEDMVVLDHVSAGRVSYVLGLGYRAEEFEMFGVPMGERALRADTGLEVLLRALSGEPFEHFGRRIAVTPEPHTPGGPSVSWGGGSKAAARRAARFGLDFMSQNADPGIEAAYLAECAASARDPGTCILTPPSTPTNVFVADDVDKAWVELGPHLLHDALTYASWNTGLASANVSTATTVDELRAEEGSHRIVDVEGALEIIREYHMLPLHPMCGGVPPEVAWPYLERVADEVLPALRGAS